MLHRIAHIFLIVALVAAVGGHWMVLQSVAWTNMLQTNLRNASVSEAIEKTFDGRHPCRLCKAIKEGKSSEKKTELPAPLKKIEFIASQPVFVFTPPCDFSLLPLMQVFNVDFCSPPPVPPPRSSPA